MQDNGVWQNRDFRWLWLGTLFIRLGSQVAIIAVTWLVLKTTGSGEKLGLVLALYAAGDMAASPTIGLLLDRLPRKLLLNADNILLGTIWVSLALLAHLHALSLPILIGLVTLSGALTPIAYLGRMIVLPNIVPGNLWESANTSMQLNMNLVTLLGPALGGVLTGLFGPLTTLVLAGAAYGVYFVCLTLIPSPRFAGHHGPGQKSWLSDLTSGWRFLGQTPLLLVLVVLTMLFSLTYGPLEPALPVLVRSIFHAGPRVLGLLWSSFAVGTITGTLLWGRLKPNWSLRRVISAIIVLWGIFSGLLGVAHTPLMADALLALGGFSYAPYNILYSVWRQKLVPDVLRGRVFGAINGLTGIGLPLGQALGGILIGALGAQGTVMVGGSLCVLLGIIAYLRPSWWGEGAPLSKPQSRPSA